MRLRNLDDLKKNINISTLIIFIIIYLLTFLGLDIIHKRYIHKRALTARQEIKSAEDLYKSNLSEKLSIIASSTIFLDYLRSGSVSRRNLYYRFFTQISSLQLPGISGMQILDSKRNLIFQHGKITNDAVSLKLCYLNQRLDPIIGDCNFIWRLSFNKENLLKSIQAINSNVKLVNEGPDSDLANGEYFSSFPLNPGSVLKLKIGVNDNNDHFFYIYLFLMSIAFLIFGSWSWYRLSSTLTNYIANPIKNLTNCLKTNHSLEQTNNIQEIEYLISEINTWKHKLNKMQTDEHVEKLGQIAAQLAHDVRSPLSAIDMLVKNLTNVPENYRTTLCNATQRISDIANNFLIQYKNPQPFLSASFSNEHIPSLLENIVSEKRSQYTNREVDIVLSIDNNAHDIFSCIDAMNFKRVLSNLINNSIEAISDSGHVNINLIKLQNFLKIEIIDTGCGISADLLPKILIGGVSFGKKGGSGLGLSHAIRKVEEWHGKLNIKSKTGIGTQIEIILPVANKNPISIGHHISASNLEC